MIDVPVDEWAIVVLAMADAGARSIDVIGNLPAASAALIQRDSRSMRGL